MAYPDLHLLGFGAQRKQQTLNLTSKTLKTFVRKQNSYLMLLKTIKFVKIGNHAFK